MIRLALQDLFDQVVDDVAVVSGKAGDEAGHVVTSLDGQRRQLQRGDPAFGPAFQRGHVLRRQVQIHHLVEVGECLVGREPQIGRADLDQLGSSAQARQRQRRIGAGRDHHVHLRG